MHTLLQDLRYGFRMLLKQKGLTAVAILSLALGIGANTALFSIVDAMLLKMLPVKEPDQLVLFKSVAPKEFSVGSYNGNSHTDPETGMHSMTSFAYQSFQRMREQQGPMSDIFAFAGVGLNLNADGEPEIPIGQAVSGNYFSALGVQPELGRVLTDEDDKPGASPVAVLSHRYWQQRFSGDPSVIGKQINLNNLAFTVIGVSAEGFNGTMGVGSIQDITIPSRDGTSNLSRSSSLVHEQQQLVVACDGPVEARSDSRAGAGATRKCFSPVSRRTSRRAASCGEGERQ